jgi:hypothetical protein
MPSNRRKQAIPQDQAGTKRGKYMSLYDRIMHDNHRRVSERADKTIDTVCAPIFALLGWLAWMALACIGFVLLFVAAVALWGLLSQLPTLVLEIAGGVFLGLVAYRAIGVLLAVLFTLLGAVFDRISA